MASDSSLTPRVGLSDSASGRNTPISRGTSQFPKVVPFWGVWEIATFVQGDYFYGNGDSYTFQGYLSGETGLDDYRIGDPIYHHTSDLDSFVSYSNSAGEEGYYVINIIDGHYQNAYSYIEIANVYGGFYDYDLDDYHEVTSTLFTPGEGLGSETGELYLPEDGEYYEFDHKIHPFENNILDYNAAFIEGTYYYGGNDDYYRFKGEITRTAGLQDYVLGEPIYANTSESDEFDNSETPEQGHYVLNKITYKNTDTTNLEQIRIHEYFDSDTGYHVIPAYSSGRFSLGSESGNISEFNNPIHNFDNLLSTDFDEFEYIQGFSVSGTYYFDASDASDAYYFEGEIHISQGIYYYQINAPIFGETSPDDAFQSSRGFYVLDYIGVITSDLFTAQDSSLKIKQYYDHESDTYYHANYDAEGEDGLGSEYSYILVGDGEFHFNHQTEYNDHEFSDYDYADIQGTYYYSDSEDSDSYTFYGNIRASEGLQDYQLNVPINPETSDLDAFEGDHEGFYVINQISELSSDPGYSSFFINEYYDYESNHTFLIHIGDGMAGVGSESAYLYIDDDTHAYVDNETEYNTGNSDVAYVRGVYYYGNGDFYTFWGTLDITVGLDDYTLGEDIYHDTSDLDYFTSDNGGFYVLSEIEYIVNDETYEEGVVIDFYSDVETQETFYTLNDFRGSNGLGSEWNTVDSKDSDHPIYFDHTADINPIPDNYALRSEVEGTYYYGNGDSYTFLAYLNDSHGISDYTIGQNIYSDTSELDAFEQGINSTGTEGYYVLDEINHYYDIATDESIVVVYDYYDSETNTSYYNEAGWVSISTTGSGLGQEDGEIAYNDQGDYIYFDNYTEADFEFGATIEGYYYYGNGDYYEVNGSISESQGLDDYEVGVRIYAETSELDSFTDIYNDSGYEGYYVLDSIVANTEIPDQFTVYIDTYYDVESNQSAVPFQVEGGGYGLGSESATLTDRNDPDLDEIDPFDEADFIAATTAYISGRYYYGDYTESTDLDSSNNDYYEISGTLDSNYGLNDYTIGERIYADSSDNDAFVDKYNETGREGYYVLDSIEFLNPDDANNEITSINIDRYYDHESQAWVFPHETYIGDIGLGSESGYLSGFIGQELDFIDNWHEADATMTVISRVVARYHYGNGDWYEVMGDIAEEHGGGAMEVGDIIDPKTSVLDQFDHKTNEVGHEGHYEILEAFTTGGLEENFLWITDYYDEETRLLIDPFEVIPGSQGFGSETGWLTAKTNADKDEFSVDKEAEIYTVVDAASSFDMREGSKFLTTLNLIGKKDINGTGNIKANTIRGNKGDNILTGLSGNDALLGKSGDDILDGGDGAYDKAVFTGAKDNYLIVKEGANTSIKDLRKKSPDGTDIAIDIEYLRFSDTQIDINKAFAKDENNNGLVDVTENYIVYNSNDPIVLTRGKKNNFIGDYTSKKWDLLGATSQGDGFELLLEGQGNLKGLFAIASSNSSGKISKIPKVKDWIAADELANVRDLTANWEIKLGRDFNDDGLKGPASLEEDPNRPGFVKAEGDYLIYNDGNPVSLFKTGKGKSSSPKALSDNTSKHWDAIAAVSNGSDGFEVLLSGDNKFDGMFAILEADSSGQMISKLNKKSWIPEEDALLEGYNLIFSVELTY